MPSHILPVHRWPCPYLSQLQQWLPCHWATPISAKIKLMGMMIKMQQSYQLHNLIVFSRESKCIVISYFMLLFIGTSSFLGFMLEFEGII